MLLIILALVLGFRVGETYAEAGPGGGHGGGGPKRLMDTLRSFPSLLIGARPRARTTSPHASPLPELSEENSSLS